MRRLFAVLVLALVGAGCGGGEDEPAPVPPDAAEVKSVQGLAERFGDRDVVLVPSVSQVSAEDPRDRFAFVVVDAGGRPIEDVEVALYVSDANGRELDGPFRGEWKPLGLEPVFESATTKAEPDGAEGIYVAELPFRGRGRAVGITALVERGGELARSSTTIRVDPSDGPPAVGEKAVRVSTPTVEDVGGALEEIDTRRPPYPDLHRDDFAELVGSKPTVLLFATPALCQSRVCGPVVDVAAQVQREMGDEVSFVHMEIYRDNQIRRGERPQVKAWRLPTEPWAFAVDAEGRVAARLEGAFTVAELRQAARAAL